jgi:voltage-gated potassium channel Kch
MLPPDGDGESLNGHAIIAGFGVPGRAVGEILASRQIPFVVIELNPKTVDRCSHSGFHMLEGDVREEHVLRRAGIERASFFAVTVPDDQTALEAVRIARMLNPNVPIIARCHFISNGMEAHRRGATEVVIEEKVVAQEFLRLLKSNTRLLPAEPLAAEQR